MAKVVKEIKTFEERKQELIILGKKNGYITFEQLAEEGVFPCILHWNQNHFVVCYGIEKCKNGGFKIHISEKPAVTSQAVRT